MILRHVNGQLISRFRSQASGSRRSVARIPLSVIGVVSLVLAACGDDASNAEPPRDGAAATAGDAAPSGGDTESGTAAQSAAEVLGVDTLRWIVLTNPGGGGDTTSRQLEPFVSEELGMPVQIDNIPGGAMTIGTNVALNEGGPECQTVFLQAVPHISLSWILDDVEFEGEDFAALGNINLDAGVVRVADDAPWQTMQELIDDALARPGEISFSTSGFSSGNYLSLVDIMQRTGAEFNIVNFDGGNPARVAVVSGEVDATHASVFNSLHIADDSRVLAVQWPQNNWPELTDDAPTMADALGIDLPDSPILLSMWVPASCRDDYPDRFQVLHDAFERAITSDGFFQLLAETGEEGKIGYMAGVDVDAFVEEYTASLVPIIESIPELELINRP